LKRLIVLGIMLMLLAAYSSITLVKADVTSIVISPDTTAPPNSTFMLNLTINNVNDMYAWSVQLVYQKIISLNLVDTINNTAFTDGTGLAIFKQEDFNSSCYTAYVARTLLDITPGVSRPGVTGSGVVAQLNFFAALNGTTAISCISSEIINSHGGDITPITVTTPTITVATPQPTPPPPKPGAVGGISFSLAKPSTDIELASILAIIACVAIMLPAIYFKGIKRRKGKH
jgi:hypothetical protein